MEKASVWVSNKCFVRVCLSCLIVDCSNMCVRKQQKEKEVITQNRDKEKRGVKREGKEEKGKEKEGRREGRKEDEAKKGPRQEMRERTDEKEGKGGEEGRKASVFVCVIFEGNLLPMMQRVSEGEEGKEKGRRRK